MVDHIKIPDVAPVIRYLADGATSAYSFPFPIFADDDLEEFLSGARQLGGYTISGAGTTSGGLVTFDTAPLEGVIIALERRMAFERLTDFTEGGDFSAQAINRELDFLVACLQQVAQDQAPMLRFDRGENPAQTSLPPRALRAGKALGFDGAGNPVALDLAGAAPPAAYTASGFGAIARLVPDKLVDFVSVKDFGAVGDGLTDDTLAFQMALTHHASVFVPSGVYILSAPITLRDGQSLYGAGDSSELRTSLPIVMVRFAGSYARLTALKLFGGQTGLYFLGSDGPCVHNSIPM